MREMSSSDGASLLHGGTESSSGDARGARRDGNDVVGAGGPRRKRGIVLDLPRRAQG